MSRRLRERAADVLQRADAARAFIDDVLAREYPRGLKTSERAILTEIVYGTARWRGTLDHVLTRYRPLARIKPKLLWVLRVAAYQMGFLTNVPDRVAVAAAVDHARAMYGEGGARLANALLRRMQREWKRQTAPVADVEPTRDVACGGDDVWRGPEGAFADPAVDLAVNLACRFSLPEWMVRRWLETFGAGNIQDLVRAQNRRAGVHCWVDPAAGEAERMAAALREEGVECEPTPFGLRVVRGAAKALASRPFRQGKLVVQDETSASVVPFLGPKKGERILEIGAAPGGKTVALARAVGEEGRVVAVDRSRRRVRRLRENLERCGVVDRVDIVVADGGGLPVGLPGGFDRVLIDAPCSNTGVLARRPDVRWRLQPADIASLAEMQERLLVAGLGAVRRGGVLVYSTCSIEEEENQGVVTSGDRQRLLREAELTLPDALRDGGYKALLQND